MNLVGAVLAGGASRRMRRDKATLEIEGERLVDRAVRKLEAVCPRVVVADRGRGLVANLSIADGPGRGPAAGILGVALGFPDHDLLILACDLPDVPAGLLECLIRLPGDLVLPRTQRGVEPLCALYRPPALAALHGRVNRDELSLHPLAGDKGISVSFLETAELRQWGDPSSFFRNLNTPEDLEEQT